MHKYVTSLGLVALLAACGPEGADTPNNDQTSNKNFDNQVCGSNPDDSKLLKQNVDIDSSIDWLMIEGVTTAAKNFSDSLPDDDFEGGFVGIAFLSPSMADIFTGLLAAYTCSEETFALNQCNWSIVGENTTTTVSTTVYGDKTYKAEVKESDNNGSNAQTTMIIDGDQTDIGNLTIRMYENDQLISTRISSRTSSGTEKVEYITDDNHWIATETRSCSGSIDLESTNKDGSIVTLDASWTYANGNTTGELDYFKTGTDGHIIRSW